MILSSTSANSISLPNFFHRSYGFAFAGDDPIVKAQIGVHVQCKAVRRNPAFDVNADRHDLAVAGMHARQTFEPESLDLKIAHRADQDFLDVADVSVNVFAVGREIDDRIADDLTDAVIRDLAAAVGFKNFDTEIFQGFGSCQNATRFRPPSERKSVRMFEQKQIIVFAVCDHVRFQLFLQIQTVGVCNPTEPFTSNCLSRIICYDKILRSNLLNSAIGNRRMNMSLLKLAFFTFCILSFTFRLTRKSAERPERPNRKSLPNQPSAKPI